MRKGRGFRFREPVERVGAGGGEKQHFFPQTRGESTTQKTGLTKYEEKMVDPKKKKRA